MKKFILLLITAMGLQSFIGTAAPVGICLHAKSPEVPADKIECFEYEKFERVGENIRLFLPAGRSVMLTAYRFRGLIPYKPDLSPTHPDFEKLLKLYEETSRATPATRAYLNPKILTMRGQAAAVVKQAENLNKLPTITLADSTKLIGCTMTKIENGVVSIRHQAGINKVNLKELDATEKKALNTTTEEWSLDDPSITPKDSSGTFAKIVFKNGRLAKNAKFKEVLDGNLVFLTSRGSASVPADQFPGELLVLGEEAMKSLAVTKSESNPSTVVEPSGIDGFQNSLGMKFVPVPIKGGKTDGQSVSFCVWETRRKDYRKFSDAVSGVDELWKDFKYNTDDLAPVIFVTIQDAMAFCKWLTEKERQEGIIPQNSEYRLPTDHEWSCAVGIGSKENWNESPVVKDGKITDVYPWGEEWPIPKEYLANNKKNEKGDKTAKAIPYAVGNLPPNSFGLHDMEGNVSEFCMIENKVALSRGANWGDLSRYTSAIEGQNKIESEQEEYFKQQLSSSTRFIFEHYDHESGDLFNGPINTSHGVIDNGFRCVLAEKSEYINHLNDSNSPNLSIKDLVQQRATLDAGKFWKFKMGIDRKQCLDLMKELKSIGLFSELSTGKVMAGWLPGSSVITGRAIAGKKIDLDGILTVPCEEIELYLIEDKLVGIEIGYSFKSEYPHDLSAIMAKDMKKYFNKDLKMEIEENDVGNRTKYYSLHRNDIAVYIRDSLDGSRKDFAPTLIIHDDKTWK